jgi:RHS repeat-associated protein
MKKAVICIIFSVFAFLFFASSSFAQESSYTFTDQEQDTSGLYYYDARYYDPDLARFISADNVDTFAITQDPQSLNRYSYVRNNPINRVDPSGNIDQRVFPLPDNLTFLYDKSSFNNLKYSQKNLVKNFISDNWNGLSHADFDFFDSIIGSDSIVKSVFFNKNNLELGKSTFSTYSSAYNSALNELNNLPSRYYSNIPEEAKLTIARAEVVLLHLGNVGQRYALGLSSSTKSMYPGIGDYNVILEKYLTNNTQIYPYDIVRANIGMQQDLFKRVLFLPGESIPQKDGQKTTIPHGSYFLIGDNLDNTIDAIAPRSSIYSKMIMKIYPSAEDIPIPPLELEKIRNFSIDY